MKLRKKLIRIISMWMLLVLLYSPQAMLVVKASEPPSTSTSDDGKSAQDKLKELQEQQRQARERIAQAEKDIKDGRNAAAAAQSKLAALKEEQRLIEEQITLKEAEIDVKALEIEQKTFEIAEKQEEYDNNDRLLQQRLVAIYRMNDASLLSTFLMVDSFSDLLTVTKNLQVITKNDTDLLDLLEAQRVELEGLRTELEGMLETLETERAELDAKWEEYNRNIAQQGIVYSEAMQRVAESQAERDAAAADEEAAQKEMEELWKSLGGSTGAYVGGALEWPVPSHNGKQYISSWYGWRTLYGKPNFHTGVDVASGGGNPINGKDIVAANAGTVVAVVINNSRSGYGSYLIIDHGGGIRTLYAHCLDIYVRNGTTVSRGQRIAAVGNTGNSTGPHLHFELRINNTEKTDPWPYLSGAKSL